MGFVGKTETNLKMNTNNGTKLWPKFMKIWLRLSINSDERATKNWYEQKIDQKNALKLILCRSDPKSDFCSTKNWSKTIK